MKENQPIGRLLLGKSTLLLTALCTLWGLACIPSQSRLNSLRRLSLEDREQSKRELIANYKKSPEDWEAFFLGILTSDEGNYKQMNHWFDESLKLSTRFDREISKRRVELWNRFASQGDSLFLGGDYGYAKVSYEKALAVDPISEATKMRLLETIVLIQGPSHNQACTLMEKGEVGALYRWLNREMGRPSLDGDRTLHDLQSDFKKRGGPAELAFIIGELCRARHRYGEMASWYRRSLEHHSRFDEALLQIQRDLSRWFYESAIQSYESGLYTKALVLLDTSLVVDPAFKPASEAKAPIRVWASGYSDSLLKVMLESPTNFNVSWYSLMLYDLYSHKKGSEAAQIASRIIDKHPEHRSARIARAFYELQTAHHDLALVDLKFIFDESNPDPLLAYNLGILSMEESQYREAEYYFQKALDWGIEGTLVWRQEAILAFYVGDFEMMKEFSRLQIQANPEDRDAWRMLAIAAEMLQDEELIKECMDKLKEH